jgi:hypothetical protein
MNSIIFFLLIAGIGWVAKKIRDIAGDTARNAKPPFKKAILEQEAPRHTQGSKKLHNEMNSKEERERPSRQYDRNSASAFDMSAEEYYQKKSKAAMKREIRENQEVSPSLTEGYLEGEDFVKGIIMSEVLGPPRSKRPYRQ